jgi:hypothetical protein
MKKDGRSKNDQSILLVEAAVAEAALMLLVFRVLLVAF